MSEGEMLLTVGSAIGALIFWGRWLFVGVGMQDGYYRNGGLKTASGFGVAAAMVLLFVVLKLWSSFDVKDSPAYLTQYWLMGAFAAAAAGTFIAPVLGLSYRVDVCENRNPSAAFAWVGVVTGFTIAYAGSNIGDGPGWWVVVFCSGLSWAFLIFLWWILEMICGIAESITVERDIGAGMRFGGFMIGIGIVAGRGAAGNWEGSTPAIADFIDVILPALPLPVIAIVAELALRSRPSLTMRGAILTGGVPGALYVTAGVLHVIFLKPW